MARGLSSPGRVPIAAIVRARLRPFLVAACIVLEGCASAVAAPAPRRPLPVAELLLVGFHGSEVAGNDDLRALICDVKVGGVILFERDVATRTPRNVVSAEQVARLTADLQALARECAGRPLLIATDGEGGGVMRLSTRAGYLSAPSHQELGDAGDLALTELEAMRMGARLREAGINWNLAPVVDVAVNPTNPAVVTLGRTFGSDPDLVTAHARAFIAGMHAAGVLTCLKHFPGHGSSRVDSHHGFTDISDTADLGRELAPYRALVKEGLADSVMPGHVFNRHIDPWYPASLSRFTVNRLLRSRLGFKGLVVSDDLLMSAVTHRYGVEEASILALGAGVDVLLISQNTVKREARAAERVVAAIRQALAQGRLSAKTVTAALQRLETFRARVKW
jgi:beta-N-acetylhexosaminidase